MKKNNTAKKATVSPVIPAKVDGRTKEGRKLKELEAPKKGAKRAPRTTVPEAPVVAPAPALPMAHRQLELSLLQQAFPNGIQPHQYPLILMSVIQGGEPTNTKERLAAGLSPIVDEASKAPAANTDEAPAAPAAKSKGKKADKAAPKAKAKGEQQELFTIRELETGPLAEKGVPTEFIGRKLQALVREGTLKAQKVGPRYHITRASLEKWLKAEGKDPSILG